LKKTISNRGGLQGLEKGALHWTFEWFKKKERQEKNAS